MVKKRKWWLMAFLSLSLLIGLSMSDKAYAAEQDPETAEGTEYVITCQVEEQPVSALSTTLNKVATFTITEYPGAILLGTIVVNLSYEYTEGVDITFTGYSYSVSPSDGYSISVGTPIIGDYSDVVVFRLPIILTRLADEAYVTRTFGADCTYYDEFTTYNY